VAIFGPKFYDRINIVRSLWIIRKDQRVLK
jgi:hypothetical protein